MYVASLGAVPALVFFFRVALLRSLITQRFANDRPRKRILFTVKKNRWTWRKKSVRGFGRFAPYVLFFLLFIESELYNLGYVASPSKDTFYITYKHLQ